ncbi:hypothetical protein ACLOJK_014526 [Asimina triloba]
MDFTDLEWVGLQIWCDKDGFFIEMSSPFFWLEKILRRTVAGDWASDLTLLSSLAARQSLYPLLRSARKIRSLSSAIVESVLHYCR